MNAAERRAKEVPMSARALFRKAAVLLLAVLVAASCAQKKAPPAPTAGGGLDPEQARAIAVEAYLYGYPLVTMEYTRRILTNAVEPGAGRAPMNRFAHVRTYVTPGHKEVVWPNSDTLYSTAWLDLSAGPMVLSLPDTRGRYYLMQVMSAWTEVLAAPGSRTSGTQAQKWVLTGPGWKGVLPPDMREIRSPTNLVWIVGRTYCEGTPEDYALVHALQDQYVLKPLAEWGKAAAPQPGRVDPAVDMKTPVREQVEALSAAEFFRLMTRLMRDNPALPQDAPLLEKMAKVGIVPGQDFDLSRLPLAVAGVLALTPQVIILDEPTTGLDHKEQEDMLELIRELHGQGHTIFMVTHSMWAAANYAHRMVVLKNGKIVLDGPPREVLAQEEVLASCRIKPPSIAQLSRGLGFMALTAEEFRRHYLIAGDN
jgi:hypothetical protein